MDTQLRVYKVIITGEIEAFSEAGAVNHWIENGFEAIEPESVSLHMVCEA